jgi:hypothetical protein
LSAEIFGQEKRVIWVGLGHPNPRNPKTDPKIPSMKFMGLAWVKNIGIFGFFGKNFRKGEFLIET